MTPLFVYGTLRKKGANHGLLGNTRFLGRAVTRARFAMFVDDRGIPYVTRSPALFPITGELYAASAETWRRVDELEGHPQWYKRDIVSVVCQGKPRMAWMYFSPKPVGKPAGTGDFLALGPGLTPASEPFFQPF